MDIHSCTVLLGYGNDCARRHFGQNVQSGSQCCNVPMPDHPDKEKFVFDPGYRYSCDFVNWGWGVFQAIIFFSEHKLNSGCIFNTFFVITKSKSIIHVLWTMQYELPHSPNWSQIWSFCMQLSKAVRVNSWRGGATVT